MLNVYCIVSTKLNSLKGDRKGVTAVEYALMGALIAAAIAGTVTSLGSNINNTLNDIATSV